MRGPFQQPLIAVEPVARLRPVAARQRIDEVERRFAGDEVPLGEPVVLYNL